MKAWWLGTLTVTVAVSCGGVSTRKSEGDGSGGASTPSTGGESPGQGGTAGSANPGTGGTQATGGSTIGTGGGGGPGVGGAGKGGKAGQGPGGSCAEGGRISPDFSCQLNPYHIECSIEVSCMLLECGRPWSPFDAEGCVRTPCIDSSECGRGQRCVAPPVVGRFEAPRGDVDGCYLLPDIGCSCSCGFLEVNSFFPTGLCLKPAELPAIECPIENLDCMALFEAARATDAHIELYGGMGAGGGGGIGGDTLEGLEACRAKIEQQKRAVCPI